MKEIKKLQLRTISYKYFRRVYISHSSKNVLKGLRALMINFLEKMLFFVKVDFKVARESWRYTVLVGVSISRYVGPSSGRRTGRLKMAKLTRPKRRRLLLNLYKAYIMQHGKNLKLRQVRFNYWEKSSRSLLGIKLCVMLHSQKHSIPDLFSFSPFHHYKTIKRPCMQRFEIKNIIN